MTIAVVILNWNGQKLLKQFLPSVITNSPEATIYVADNASTDNSIRFLQTNYPEVKIIKNPTNGGYTKGYNNALKHLNEDIYCLLNSDVEVTKHWLQPILNAFKQYTNTAILQPKILDYKCKTHFEYAGAAGGFIDKYGYPYCKGRIFNTLEKDNNQYEESDILWASGACLFIRNKVFKQLQGFDETFFAHYEEIDLCWRAFNLGYNTKCITESIVYHVGGATLAHNNPKKTYLNFRNSLFSITKNAPGNLVAIIFTRLCLDGIAGLKFLFTLKFSHFSAILKAHFSFYFALSYLLKERKKLQQNKNYYSLKSIVWAYFVKGKQTFSSL